MYNEKEIVSKWADILIQRWRKNLRRRKVGKDGALNKSFAYSILSAPDGSVILAKLEFLFYGRFVDMGVGKGTTIDKVSRSQMADKVRGKRRPKKWYSGTLAGETRKLATILSTEIGGEGIQSIESALDKIKVTAEI
jgi:hypothetical protein